VTLIGVLLFGQRGVGADGLGGALANLAAARGRDLLGVRSDRAEAAWRRAGHLTTGGLVARPCFFSLVTRNAAEGGVGLGGGLYLAEGGDAGRTRP